MGDSKYIGCKYVEYVSKKTNQLVRGYEVYFVEEQNNVCGLACVKSWISVSIYDSFFKDLPFDSIVILSYNRFGSINGVVKIIN